MTPTARPCSIAFLGLVISALISASSAARSVQRLETVLQGSPGDGRALPTSPDSATPLAPQSSPPHSSGTSVWAPPSVFGGGTNGPTLPEPTPSPPPSSGEGERYMGCFNDVSRSLFPVFLGASATNMTLELCRNLASRAGMAFFGVEGGRQCFGSRDLFGAQIYSVSDACDVFCSGNAGQVCGGSGALSVYYQPQAGSPPPGGQSAPSGGHEPTLLPPLFRPEVAYFDAAVGLSYSSVSGYGPTQTALRVSAWADVDAGSRPGNTLRFGGDCRPSRVYGSGGTGAGGGYTSSPVIGFDGASCSAKLPGDLPSTWKTHGSSRFTAVWIGRFSGYPQGQSLLSLGRTLADADRQLYWGTDSTIISSYAAGTALMVGRATSGANGVGGGGAGLPPPPAGQWTMEVLSRSDGDVNYGTGITVSYYRYGLQTGEFSAWRFPSWPCEVGPDGLTIGIDPQYGGLYFAGELAAVLLYNRSLSEADVVAIAKVYQPRFGWIPAPGSTPMASPPAPWWGTGSSPSPSGSPGSLSPPVIVPDGSYMGCYQDSGFRALPEMYEVSYTGMTIDRCRDLAQQRGLPYYGLESGTECFAGYDVMRVLTRGPSAACGLPCSGNSSQICGGWWAISVYATPAAPSPPPALSPGCFVGCFRDRNDWRSLPDMYRQSDKMTIERCRRRAQTAGYAYFGVEAGTQCFASNNLSRAQINGRDSGCNWRCGGDASQVCGGDWAISIYRSYDGEMPSPPPPPSPSPPPPSLRKQDLVGCYADSADFRVLPTLLAVSEAMTLGLCRKEAKARGFQLFGVEASRECYAGDDLSRATLLGPSTRCDWPCAGRACEVCGGDRAILIYTTSGGAFSSPPPAPGVPTYGTPPPAAPYPSWPTYVPPQLPSAPPHYSDYYQPPPDNDFQPPPAEDQPPPLTDYQQPPPAEDQQPPPLTDYQQPPPAEDQPPPVYGAELSPPLHPPQPSPQAPAFVLPEALRPEAAYFDAIVGVTDYLDSMGNGNVVLLWKDVFVSERPGNLLYFDGNCRMAPSRTPSSSTPSSASSLLQAAAAPPAIRFDGQSCIAVLDDQLPTDSWGASASGVFTAVWIGRPADDDESSADEQMIMGLSRTPSDYDQELYWSNQRAFIYSHASGLSASTDIPPSMGNQWTMKVLSRELTADADDAHVYGGGLKLSYRSYDQSSPGVMRSFSVPAAPSEVSPDKLVLGADYRDGDRFFAGDVSVVLLYNRSLGDGEVRELAAFYSARFEWAVPVDGSLGWAPPPDDSVTGRTR